MENGCSVSRYECERKGKIYSPAFFCPGRKCAQVVLQANKRTNIRRVIKMTNTGYVGRVFSRQINKLIRALVKSYFHS